jgi:hypothetical protein
MPKILINAFNQGGVADSKYSGIKHSNARLIGWDIHSEPGLLKVNQKMSKISGQTVDTFCKVVVAASNNIRYWFSATTGKIWQEKAGVFTLVYTFANPAQITAGAGALGAIEYEGYLYWFTQNYVNRIFVDNADGASAWTTNVSTIWAELNLDQRFYQFSGITYAMTTGVNEGATHRHTFVADELLLETISFRLPAKGTGDVTVVVHNSANTVIGTKTIANASLLNGAINYFQFSTPLNLTKGSTYHVHVYSTVADGTVDVLQLNNLEASAMSLYRTSSSSYHPTRIVDAVLYIGDNQYVHQIDGETFTAKALDIESQYQISALGKYGTDLLVGTIISSSVSFCEIFRWNTWSVSFTNSDIIFEPGINAFLEADNYVIVNAGLAGNLYSYNGQQLEFYKKIPGTYSPTKQAIIYGNASALLNGFLPIFGVSNYTGDPCDQGIWSLGNHSSNYPIVRNLEFPTSNVDANNYNILTGIEIGAIIVVGQDVYNSWQRKVTITVTIASPAVATYTAHGLSNGDAIVFTTTGALPTGITAGTTYYIRSIDANTFNLYDTSAHAIAGGSTGRVDTTGSQSGVHTGATIGIDKLDYSNKIIHPILETPVLSPLPGIFTTFSKFIATYEGSMPASTALAFKYGKNGLAADTGTDITSVDDADRAQVIADCSQLDARTLQLRLEATSNNNDAPEVQEIIIETQ